MGPSGDWIEVQIRSKRMDEIAERGFAAHWQYKHTGGGGSSELDKWLKKIRELLENPNSNALEFLDDFKLNLFSSEILVFTPKGKIISLPKDSTALDFAYEIHSEIGNKAIGAKINHKLVPLNHKLNSGDQIEILTSDIQKVQPEWFNNVITAKAKSAIKSSIKADTKNRIEIGKKMLEDKLKEYNLKPSSRIFKKLLPEYEVISKDELYSKIGSGIITLEDLKKILKKNTQNKWIRYWGLQFGFVSRTVKETPRPPTKVPTTGKNPDYYIIRENPDEADKDYLLARCCNPIPGDNVIGYRDQDNSIVIHKANCQNALKLISREGNRIIPANWTTHKILSYLVRISIGGVDKFGIYNNITTVISKELAVNMRNINLASHDGIFDGTIDIYVHNTADLNNLIMNLSKIKGVESVNRMETMEE
jgi:GTP pyrophosphokinase